MRIVDDAGMGELPEPGMLMIDASEPDAADSVVIQLSGRVAPMSLVLTGSQDSG